MKTHEEIKAEALRLITEKVREDHRPVDSDARYRAMLDEVYDFSSVGGPFSHMLASRVLEEMDPTAYRCGKNDWMDGEDIREFDGSEWDGSDLDEAKEEVEDDLESEISDKEKEEGKAEAEVEKAEERVAAASEEDSADNLDDAKEELSQARDRLADVQAELVKLNATLAAVNAYSF